MAFHRPTGSVAEAAIDVEGLFHRHYARLVAALTLVAGDRGAAEEAAQQAFVELWRHWDRVREYDHPQAWLMRSAVGRLRNERRRVGRLMRTLVRLSPAPDSLEAPTPYTPRYGMDFGDYPYVNEKRHPCISSWA